MSVFSNPFFSLAGQKERLTNVLNVGSAAVLGIVGKGPGVHANPVKGLTTVGKVTEAVVNTPGGVLIAAAAITPAFATAGGAVARGAVASTVAKAPLKAKVGAALLAPAALGFVKEAPGEATKAVVSTPGKLAAFGADVGRFAADPTLQNAKDIITENKAVLIAGGVAAAALSAPLVASGASAFTASKQASASEALGGAISDVAKAASAAPAMVGGFGKGDTNGQVPVESSAEIVPGSTPAAALPVAAAAKASQTTKKYKRKVNGGAINVNIKIPRASGFGRRSAYSRDLRFGVGFAQKERLLQAA